MIRSFGGRVSWEDAGGVGGGPFRADDKRITHHIVDRPSISGQPFDGRYYVQPQWVYDCVNAKMVRGQFTERKRESVCVRVRVRVFVCACVCVCVHAGGVCAKLLTVQLSSLRVCLYDQASVWELHKESTDTIDSTASLGSVCLVVFSR